MLCDALWYSGSSLCCSEGLCGALWGMWYSIALWGALGTLGMSGIFQELRAALRNSGGLCHTLGYSELSDALWVSSRFWGVCAAQPESHSSPPPVRIGPPFLCGLR